MLNRDEYIERLLTVRGLRFSRNAYFPPVKYCTTTNTGQVVQVQIYPSSLAVNLQNLTKETVLRYGSFILREIVCQGDVDTSLMRFCVDAEWRMDRTLSRSEKFQLIVAYYSFRWLDATVTAFDIVGAMHQFLHRGLRLFTMDHGRYWYSFEREKKRESRNSRSLCPGHPLHHCPHAGEFRAFVITFLTSRGHEFAAQQIRKTFPHNPESMTKEATSGPSSALNWYETHVVDNRCLYS